MSAVGETPVPREARPYQGRHAGLVTRLIAAALDLVVVAAVLAAAYAGWCGFLLLLDPRGFSFPEVGVVFSLLSAFVVSVGYLTVAWSLSGRSYGDLVMGLRVVGPGGRRLHVVSAFLRAVACVVLPIGLLWIGVSRQKRSLQDVVLRTSVVYDWQPRTAHPRKA
ncbi:RDD family protein [Terrabacter sp. NPDC080008]|uniref:RDD family protein n=1 Tax=Terrabacter sp. NPDC080008 TaxID=3155176 RepID=UPI003450EE9A